MIEGDAHDGGVLADLGTRRTLLDEGLLAELADDGLRGAADDGLAQALHNDRSFFLRLFIHPCREQKRVPSPKRITSIPVCRILTASMSAAVTSSQHRSTPGLVECGAFVIPHRGTTGKRHNLLELNKRQTTQAIDSCNRQLLQKHSRAYIAQLQNLIH